MSTGSQSVKRSFSLYPNRDACFESNHSISDSVSRLSAMLNRNTWKTLFEVSIVGTVSPSAVTIYYDRRSLGLVFKGAFSERNGSAVLSGRFEVPRFARIFYDSWLLGSILLFVFPFIHFRTDAPRYAFLALPIFFLLFWFANVFLSYRNGQRDIEYISQVINEALL